METLNKFKSMVRGRERKRTTLVWACWSSLELCFRIAANFVETPSVYFDHRYFNTIHIKYFLINQKAYLTQCMYVNIKIYIYAALFKLLLFLLLLF